MGFITTGVSLIYLIYAYSTPGTLFAYSDKNASRLFSCAIVLPLFVWLVGGIQGKLRNAAIREWTAREEAEAEAVQRRQTEEVLRSSEDMWRLVVDSAMDGIIAVDEEGRITLWNRNAEQMFGWTSEEIIGRLLSDTIVPPSHREAHSAGLRRFTETGIARILGRRLELPALAKDGHEFPVEISIVNHQTQQGLLFIGFVRDLTEQKKLNERLRQAQKMEAVGTLAGGIAHEFNNILATISGNLSLARADLASEHVGQESLAEIEKAIGRATYVVRQILTFSRVNEAHAEPIDVSETLREAVGLLRATISSTMTIDLHIDDDVPPILADSTDIHQIVLNLGINAFHAMSGQSGAFEIRVQPIMLDDATAESLLHISPGQYVRITVGDTGCGMDKQLLQRVFEPFFTTKAQGEGTGLGLSVVYGIVERHGGAITVYSEPGKGTVFHLYFPAVDRPVAKGEAKAEPTVSGNGEKILYVDDDEAIVFMMTRMLRRLNYDVVAYQHPGEALEAFRANPNEFDVVVTDMSMPQMAGPDLVREMLAIRPDIPIVMATGYIRPKDLEQARDLGIRELVLKPNTVAEMGEVLHRIVSELRTIA